MNSRFHTLQGQRKMYVQAALAAAAVSITALSMLQGCTNPYETDEEPGFYGDWKPRYGIDSRNTEFHFGNNTYEIHYSKLCVTDNFDTVTILRDERGTFSYDFEADEGGNYSDGTWWWYGRGWHGKLRFVPDNAQPWDCEYHYHEPNSLSSDWGITLPIVVCPGDTCFFELEKVKPISSTTAGYAVERLNNAVSLIADIRGGGSASCFGIGADGAARLLPSYTIRNNTDTIVSGMSTSPTTGLFEYRYESNEWTRTLVSAAGLNVQQPVAARCRSDGKTRLYAEAGDGEIHEFEYASGEWTTTPVRPTGDSIPYARLHIAADLRGDNTSSLILSGRPAPDTTTLFELRWTGSAWNSTRIGDLVTLGLTMPAFPAALAAGDLAGRNRQSVFVLTAGSAVVEYRLEGDSVWTHAAIDTVNSTEDSRAVSNAGMWVLPDCSGGFSLFFTAFGVWEMKHDALGWNRNMMYDGVEENVSLSSGSLGGSYRLFITNGYLDGPREYACLGTSLTCRQTVPVPYSGTIVVGPGRGDGVNRVYVQDPYYTYELTPQ